MSPLCVMHRGLFPFRLVPIGSVNSFRLIPNDSDWFRLIPNNSPNHPDFMLYSMFLC